MWYGDITAHIQGIMSLMTYHISSPQAHCSRFCITLVQREPPVLLPWRIPSSPALSRMPSWRQLRWATMSREWRIVIPSCFYLIFIWDNETRYHLLLKNNPKMCMLNPFQFLIIGHSPTIEHKTKVDSAGVHLPQNRPWIDSPKCIVHSWSWCWSNFPLSDCSILDGVIRISQIFVLVGIDEQVYCTFYMNTVLAVSSSLFTLLS